MNPLSLLEIGPDWDEARALQFGFLPGVYSLKKDLEKKKLLQSYPKSPENPVHSASLGGMVNGENKKDHSGASCD